MKLWKNLSNRLDAVADVMAAKPCMQGCVGKTLLSIPRTPGNLITAVILAIGLLITIGRFGFGLGAVTNLDDNNPWGIWIAFDLLCGVALAAGGYVTSSACYLFGMKRYHSAVRPAILTAFLGYAFVVVALLYDVGQPWRLPYPLLVSQGTTSLLFEVGLCVGIYLTVLFIEWSPVGLEWLLGMKDAPCWLVRLRPRMHTIRKAVLCFTIPLTILGVVLSTMHQSSLGALFLIAPSKMHPCGTRRLCRCSSSSPRWWPVFRWSSSKVRCPTRHCTTRWMKPTCMKPTALCSASAARLPSC